MADVPKSFPLVYKDHLLDLFNQEVGEDVARALGRCEGAVKTVRFIEGLQQDDLERHNRLLLLIREIEVKAREKSKFILRLSSYEVYKKMLRLSVADKAKANIRIQRGAEVHCCAFKLLTPQRMATLPRAITEDLRLEREINGLCDGLTGVIEERELFIGELKTLLDIFVPDKMCEFLKETQAKYTDKMMKFSDTVQSFFLFLVDDDNSERSERFAEEPFGSAVVLALVLWFFDRFVSNFLAVMVETIVCATSSMRHVVMLREISKDLWLSREINALCARLTDIVDERERFVDELDRLIGRLAPERMAEFMKEV
ncbi:hypothetical protein Tco_1384955 [Tanacetum coccineum]